MTLSYQSVNVRKKNMAGLHEPPLWGLIWPGGDPEFLPVCCVLIINFLHRISMTTEAALIYGGFSLC